MQKSEKLELEVKNKVDASFDIPDSTWIYVGQVLYDNQPRDPSQRDPRSFAFKFDTTAFPEIYDIIWFFFAYRQYQSIIIYILYFYQDL